MMLVVICAFESRLKSHFSHITPTLFTVPIDFILPLTSCRVFSERDCMD